MLVEAVRVLEAAGTPAIILSNVTLDRQIDLIVATAGGMLLIEAKAQNLPVRGAMNGLDWEVVTAAGTNVRTGNAYQQTLAAVLALRDAMRQFAGREPAYPKGALIYCPAVPRGSHLPASDFRISLGDLADLSSLIPGPRSRGWSLDQWRAFARSLGMTGVSSLGQALDVRLHEADLALSDYRTAFERAYGSARSLVPLACRGAGGETDLAALAELAADGQSLLISGPSGCGKSLTGQLAGLHAAANNAVPIIAYARDFAGDLSALLNREATLLGAPSFRVLFGACQRLGQRVLLILDGYNECPAELQGRAIRAIAAAARRYRLNLLISTQGEIALADLLDLTSWAVEAPDRAAKLAIARTANAEPLPAAVHAWIDAINSGLEARILGVIGAQVPDPGNRSALFDRYARHLLRDASSSGLHALIEIARFMSQRVTFSLTSRDLDRLAAAQAISSATLRALERVGLLVRREDRISFGHELFLAAFAIEAEVRAAGDDPDRLAAVLDKPMNWRRGVDLIGALDDPVLQRAVLDRVVDADTVAACLAGACGSSAKQWAAERVAVVLHRMGKEVETLSWAIDERNAWQVTRTDDVWSDWTLPDHAVVATLAGSFLAGQNVDVIMALLKQTDERLREEFLRLRVELGDRKLALRTGMFAWTYVFGAQNAPAIGTIVRALHTGLWRKAEENHASAIIAAWAPRADLSDGQLYILLAVNRLDDQGTAIAPWLARYLRERYKYAPYHLKLDLLSAAYFSRQAPEDARAELCEVLSALLEEEGNVIFSGEMLEALARLGGLDESEVEETGRVRAQLAEILDQDDDLTDRAASHIWHSQMEHPLAGAYCEVVSELSPENRKRLLIKAARAADLDYSFAGILMVELTALDDSAVGPLFEKWLALPSRTSVCSQETTGAFLLAHIALGRLGQAINVPVDEDEAPEARALRALGTLLYWLNRRDLSLADRQIQASDQASKLLATPVASATALYEASRCFIEEGLRNMGGEPPPIGEILSSYPDIFTSLCRAVLVGSPDIIAYYRHIEERQVRTFAVRMLGFRGDAGDLALLRPLAEDIGIGSEAITAVAKIEARLSNVESSEVTGSTS